MSTHLDQLLVQLRELAPHFGRAAKDIQAIGSRAESQDYRGVLQNTRLVVETLLRAVIAKKKQTPGKQTLEKLIVKLQGDLPTHIQVHVRTIQAWGNVSAHDHSAELSDSGLEVGKDEAITAINSLVVILNWYRSEHLADAPVPSLPSAPASAPSAESTSPAAPPAKPEVSILKVLGGLAVLAVAGTGYWMMTKNVTDTTVGTDVNVTELPQSELDEASWAAAYSSQGEPLPPSACRVPPPHRRTEVAALEQLAGGKAASNRASDQLARKSLEAMSQNLAAYGEHWALLARARLQTGASPEQTLEALEAGLAACKDFAVLHNMKGRLHMQSEDPAAAEKAFKRAKTLDSEYQAPRLNLGLIAMGKGQFAQASQTFDAVIAANPKLAEAYQARGAVRLVMKLNDEAVMDLSKATELEPDNAQGFFLLGKALSAQDKASEAGRAYCRAKALGSAAAAALCTSN